MARRLRFIEKGLAAERVQQPDGLRDESDEWRSKYDFQVVPNHQRPVMGVASHKLGKCEIPKKTLRDRDPDAFVRATFDKWLYPRDAAPYVTDAKPGLLAENDWNGRVDQSWSTYERRVRDSPSFLRFLTLRQKALLAHASGRNVSFREACGLQIHATWARCFEDADARWERRGGTPRVPAGGVSSLCCLSSMACTADVGAALGNRCPFL